MFIKRSMKSVTSYCDECSPSHAKKLTRRNIYKRKRPKEEGKDAVRILILEEEFKELKNVFETISSTMKKEMGIIVGQAINSVMDKTYSNIEKDMKLQTDIMKEKTEEHVSNEFDKLNVKFSNQLATLNTRMLRLKKEYSTLDETMTEHLHYYATKMNMKVSPKLGASKNKGKRRKKE